MLHPFFSAGEKFRSDHIDGCTVEVIEAANNELRVRIVRDDTGFRWDERWDVEHTKQGFKRGDCRKL